LKIALCNSNVGQVVEPPSDPFGGFYVACDCECASVFFQRGGIFLAVGMNVSKIVQPDLLFIAISAATVIRLSFAEITKRGVIIAQTEIARAQIAEGAGEGIRGTQCGEGGACALQPINRLVVSA